MALTLKSPSPVTAQLNLDALGGNLARVRALAPNSRILAVVKADAYGHGLVRIAHALSAADAFAVARVEEGEMLRRAGIAHRIVVLQGFTFSGELKIHLAQRLEPVIHSLSQIEMLARRKAPKIRPWIKLDTGMHRLGLSTEEFISAFRRLAHLNPIAMTHLCCADDTDNPATARQLALFEQATRDLGADRSIANSAAILAWPHSHLEWVRPGLMLYGLSPFPGRSGSELGLQPVMTLKSRIIAIKRLKKGDHVGYGASWTAPRPSRLGIVSAGYGDGYPREIAPGTQVLVGVHKAPVVGRVSMDMLTVDLTGLHDIKEGCEVTLWGQGLPVEKIAAAAGTIPYTLLCGVTPRVVRLETSMKNGTIQGCL